MGYLKKWFSALRVEGVMYIYVWWLLLYCFWGLWNDNMTNIKILLHCCWNLSSLDLWSSRTWNISTTYNKTIITSRTYIETRISTHLSHLMVILFSYFTCIFLSFVTGWSWLSSWFWPSCWWWFWLWSGGSTCSVNPSAQSLTQVTLYTIMKYLT